MYDYADHADLLFLYNIPETAEAHVWMEAPRTETLTRPMEAETFQEISEFGHCVLV